MKGFKISNIRTEPFEKIIDNGRLATSMTPKKLAKAYNKFKGSMRCRGVLTNKKCEKTFFHICDELGPTMQSCHGTRRHTQTHAHVFYKKKKTPPSTTAQLPMFFFILSIIRSPLPLDNANAERPGRPISTVHVCVCTHVYVCASYGSAVVTHTHHVRQINVQINDMRTLIAGYVPGVSWETNGEDMESKGAIKKRNSR